MKRLLVILLLFYVQNIFSNNLGKNDLALIFGAKGEPGFNDSPPFNSGSTPDSIGAKKQSVNSSGINSLKSNQVTNSALASGRWIKARTSQSCIHRITFASLKAMGFQSPQKVKVFGFPPGKLPQMNHLPSADDLIQYRIWPTKDKQQNDCFLIYVPGRVTWEFNPVSKTFIHSINPFAGGLSFLYLTEDLATDLIVPVTPLRTGTTTAIVSEFDDFTFF